MAPRELENRFDPPSLDFSLVWRIFADFSEGTDVRSN